MPMMSSRRRPKMSPIRPKVMSSEAKTRAYTELIHSASEAVSEMSRISTGRTTLTTVASMMMMDTASAMIGIAFQRLGFSVDSTVEGGGASVTVGSLFSLDTDTDLSLIHISEPTRRTPISY